MAKRETDALQGTLDLLILKTLDRGRRHGYGITVHVQAASDDVLRVEEGSLYPALHRLEKEGLLAAEWGQAETGRRARFYRLTPAGRARLSDEQERWVRLTRAVGKFLRFA